MLQNSSKRQPNQQAHYCQSRHMNEQAHKVAWHICVTLHTFCISSPSGQNLFCYNYITILRPPQLHPLSHGANSSICSEPTPELHKMRHSGVQARRQMCHMFQQHALNGSKRLYMSPLISVSSHGKWGRQN